MSSPSLPTFYCRRGTLFEDLFSSECPLEAHCPVPARAELKRDYDQLLHAADGLAARAMPSGAPAALKAA